MNENEKDFMNQMNNLDDFSVEEIAEKYPALDENAKKRIVNKCMEKSGFSVEAESEYDDEGEIVVSGTERYNRILWHKYTSSVAAFIIAVVGITSVVILHKNLNGNDDFEIDETPAVSNYSSENETSTEETTVTTKDRGYVAGGHDYANDTEYSGIIVGGVPQTPPTVEEPVSESENNNSNNNTPPAQPVTQAPVAPPVTEAPTAVTEPVTDNVQSESQNSYLDLLYYVELSGEYMGFDFGSDGSLTKYTFDEYGVAMDNTIVTTTYEIVENQFSYVSPDGYKRTGTIVSKDDIGNFIVNFDDGEVYNFNIQRPDFKVFFSLSGTDWYWVDENNYSENLEIEFSEDGINGNYIIFSEDVTTMESTKIPFTYEKNGYEIIFHVKDPTCNILHVELIVPDGLDNVLVLENIPLAVEYTDGSIKYFYNGN